jgi:hypothetical protein
MTNTMDNIEKYQKQLLEQTQKLYQETPISEATVQAYLATPRHCFVKRYRGMVHQGMACSQSR